MDEIKVTKDSNWKEPADRWNIDLSKAGEDEFFEIGRDHDVMKNPEETSSDEEECSEFGRPDYSRSISSTPQGDKNAGQDLLIGTEEDKSVSSGFSKLKGDDEPVIPLKEWEKYIKSQKLIENHVELSRKIVKFLRQSGEASAAAILSEVVTMMSPLTYEKIMRNICFVGQKGSSLLSVKHVTGYVYGVKDSIDVHNHEELKRMKVFHERSMVDMKKLNEQVLSLLQTYSAGADTFKQNLEKMSSMVAKANYEPPSPSLSSISERPTSTRQRTIEWGKQTIYLEDDKWKINITMTEYKNGPGIKPFFPIFEYINTLKTRELRQKCFRCEPYYLTHVMEQFPKKENMTLKELLSSYLAKYPSRVKATPPALQWSTT